MKPILCVDFDGVIHSYTSPWSGEWNIPDPPVPGALEWLRNAQKLFSINIYSSRSFSSDAVEAMKTWIALWAAQEPLHWPPETTHEFISALQFPKSKPPAFLSIDDRAIQFRGDWKELEPEELLNFRPWNKR